MLERFETAVLDMDEPGIAAACPLLAPLGLATQGQELYLGFARRALEAQLGAEVGDESAPAAQRLPAIYNVSAAFLRRCVYGLCLWAGGGLGGDKSVSARVCRGWVLLRGGCLRAVAMENLLLLVAPCEYLETRMYVIAEVS